jgi:hypothetical protein
MTLEPQPLTIEDFSVTIELTVKEINTLLNILNMPSQVPSTTLVGFINLIQQQAGPQAQKAQDSLDAVIKANNEPETAA